MDYIDLKAYCEEADAYGIDPAAGIESNRIKHRKRIEKIQDERTNS